MLDHWVRLKERTQKTPGKRYTVMTNLTVYIGGHLPLQTVLLGAYVLTCVCTFFIVVRVFVWLLQCLIGRVSRYLISVRGHELRSGMFTVLFRIKILDQIIKITLILSYLLYR